MEIKDLKVDMRFYKWTLGYGPTIGNNDDLPVALRPFFSIYTIDKVNKVTFVADGVKMHGIPDDWHVLDIDKMYTTVRIRGKRYMSDVDSNGEVRCSWYMKQYTKFFQSLSKEELADIEDAIDMMINIRLHSKYEKDRAAAKHKTKLYLGLREKEYGEC